ncbi:hypothetical protein V496_07218 [Pseudogymnoascus sp. VKM F-4515 (FW-2607)]|nr:hypothetical protein V496_07218 [Pseudogymnoascus sp. VKM F-4515 (FW-2607)]
MFFCLAAKNILGTAKSPQGFLVCGDKFSPWGICGGVVVVNRPWHMRSICGEWFMFTRYLPNLRRMQDDSNRRVEKSQGLMPRGGMSRGSGSSSVIAITSEVRAMGTRPEARDLMVICLDPPYISPALFPTVPNE